MSEQNLPIRLRPATEEDVPFVFNSWLKSYRSSVATKHISNTIFFAEQHKIIEALVIQNQVIMACNDKDPTQVYGYICAGQVDGIFTLHFVYVKHSFRNLGIGKMLLNAFDHNTDTAAIYTHHTRFADKLAPKFNFVYHPYTIFPVVFEYYKRREAEKESNE
jgi:ribosomal protein S18 acetylase RimI-like enzyme